MVLSSRGGPDPETREALSQLCRQYWRPVFAVICRSGRSLDEAQDLTQDFFLTVLDGKLLQGADPSRGRFRKLLLKALQNFLVDAHDRRSAMKRGGHMQFISWDHWIAEAPSHLAVAPRTIEQWSAERLFDVRWAATIVEQSLRQLREECEASGRRRIFDAVSGCFAAEREDVSYAKLAKFLNVSEATVKRVVHQLRRRYREILRREVAQTVATEAEVDDEIRYLCKVLAVNG